MLAVAAVTVQCACTSLVFLCFSFLCNAEEELHQNLGKGGCFTLQNNNLRKNGFTVAAVTVHVHHLFLFVSLFFAMLKNCTKI